jgi:hypothetical protein
VVCLKFDDAEFVSNTPSRVPKWGGGSVGHSIGLSRLILCISDATGTVFSFRLSIDILGCLLGVSAEKLLLRTHVEMLRGGAPCWRG